jgi:Zn-dependent metalloprotease
MNPRKISTMLLASALVAIALALLRPNWPIHRVTAQRESSTSVDPQVAALTRLQAASRTPVRFSFAGGFPRSVMARVETKGRDAVARAEFFLSQYRDLYAQNRPQLKLKVRRVNRPPVEDVLFYQTYRGLEVFGAGLLVNLDGPQVFHTAGALITSDVTLDTAPEIPEEQAVSIIRRGLELADARLGAPTTLMVFDRSLLDSKSTSHPRLAWRVTFEHGEIKQVFVDAHDGKILLMLPSAYDSGGPLHGLNLNMHDAQNVFQGKTTACFSFGTKLVATEGLVSFFNSSYKNDQDAVQGLAYIKNIYSFFHENFNRHSYDDDYSPIDLYIHSTYNPIARWSAACELIEVESGKVGFDVLAHEFTHGVIDDTSQLVYALQAGALNESYADILAAIADQEREESLEKKTDWLVGEELTDGSSAIRDLSNPGMDTDPPNQPDHMTKPFKPKTCDPPILDAPAKCNDYGGVHKNSGIPNITAFLMSDGGTHPTSGLTVMGMGRDKTRNLKWIAATHLIYFADFQMAAGFEIAMAANWAASKKYGFTAADVCTVRNAWAAVGIGQPDSDCDGIENSSDADPDGDSIVTGPDNCPNDKNPSQKNSDNDSKGDACDADDDNDGVQDTKDNCPTIPNPPNASGVQPPCDDLDDDKIPDWKDNCPGLSNPRQTDSDGDNEGDACETDTDNDGINNDSDNCPVVKNKDQANQDGDAFGDACDKCPVTKDPNPAFTPNGMPFQPDSDDDGTPDTCDSSLKYDNASITPGIVVADNRWHTLRAEARRLRKLSVPLTICRTCPEWFDLNNRVKLEFTGLDPNMRVIVSDELGKSVKKAVALGERRELSFKPVAGHRYFLSLLFGERMDERAETFAMKMSTHGFKEQNRAPPR